MWLVNHRLAGKHQSQNGSVSVLLAAGWGVDPAFKRQVLEAYVNTYHQAKLSGFLPLSLELKPFNGDHFAIPLTFYCFCPDSRLLHLTSLLLFLVTVKINTFLRWLSHDLEPSHFTIDQHTETANLIFSQYCNCKQKENSSVSKEKVMPYQAVYALLYCF